MKDINEYQKITNKTRLYKPKLDHSVIYPLLGLTEETGELIGKIKKIFRDKDGQIDEEDLQALKLELGDIMWNMVVCAEALGLQMSDILEGNLKKLEDRRNRNAIKGSGDYR